MMCAKNGSRIYPAVKKNGKVVFVFAFAEDKRIEEHPILFSYPGPEYVYDFHEERTRCNSLVYHCIRRHDSSGALDCLGRVTISRDRKRVLSVFGHSHRRDQEHYNMIRRRCIGLCYWSNDKEPINQMYLEPIKYEEKIGKSLKSRCAWYSKTSLITLL